MENKIQTESKIDEATLQEVIDCEIEDYKINHRGICEWCGFESFLTEARIDAGEEVKICWDCKCRLEQKSREA